MDQAARVVLGGQDIAALGAVDLDDRASSALCGAPLHEVRCAAGWLVSPVRISSRRGGVRDGDFSHIDMDFIERVVAPRHELGRNGALPFAVRGCLGLGTHG